MSTEEAKPFTTLFNRLYDRLYEHAGLKQNGVKGVDQSYIRAMRTHDWVPDDKTIRKLRNGLEEVAKGIKKVGPLKVPLAVIEIPTEDVWLKAARHQRKDRRPASQRFVRPPNVKSLESDEFARRFYLPYRTKEVPLLHSERLAEYLAVRHKCSALRLADASFPVTVLWKNETGKDGKSLVCNPDSILGPLDRTQPTPFKECPILPPKEYAKARERIKSVFIRGPIKWEGWNYRMNRIELLGKGAKIHGAVGLYYDNVLTQYALEWELKSVLVLGEKHAFKRISQRGSLPLREAIESQCKSLLDGSGRCTAMTVSTLLVFHLGNGQRCCLLRRRSQQVGLSPGMLHVVPAGMFEAKNLDVNWSIQANMWSELLEEVYDEKEQQTGPPHLEYDVPEKQPIKWILENLSNGVVEFSVTGICCDLLNLRPEICTVLFIKDPKFLAVRGFKLNWEYDDLGIDGRIAVPWENIDEVIRTEVAKINEGQGPGKDRGGIVCSGAACLALGREWVNRRFGCS